MKDILAAAAPYGMIKDAESLIQTVEGVNTALVTKRRDHVLQRIDAHIAKVEAELDAAQASNELRNQCLYPLQTLKRQVEAQTSIAHINQAQQSCSRGGGRGDRQDRGRIKVKRQVRHRGSGAAGLRQEAAHRPSRKAGTQGVARNPSGRRWLSGAPPARVRGGPREWRAHRDPLMIPDIQDKIRRRHDELSRHAVDQGIQRNLSIAEIEEALLGTCELIEDYPDDKYGPSCLILGFTKAGRPVHVLSSHPSRPLLKIITLYEPDPADWIGHRVRRTRAEGETQEVSAS